MHKKEKKFVTWLYGSQHQTKMQELLMDIPPIKFSVGNARHWLYVCYLCTLKPLHISQTVCRKDKEKFKLGS